jgi:hypothetical protein
VEKIQAALSKARTERSAVLGVRAASVSAPAVAAPKAIDLVVPPEPMAAASGRPFMTSSLKGLVDLRTTLVGWGWVVAVAGVVSIAAFSPMDSLWRGLPGMVLAAVALVLTVIVYRGGMRFAQSLTTQTALLQSRFDALTQGTPPIPEVAPDPVPKQRRSGAKQPKGSATVLEMFSVPPDLGADPAPEAKPMAEGATIPSTEAPIAVDVPTVPEVRASPDVPVSIADLVRAMNFPVNAEDEDGFQALRLALADPRTAPLIQSALAVLTVLWQDGLDRPDWRMVPSDTSLWRQIAAGTGVQQTDVTLDPASLAQTAQRLQVDPAFRAASGRLLDSFHSTMSAVGKTASDHDLGQIGDTRTAWAFLMCASAAGAFAQ